MSKDVRPVYMGTFEKYKKEVEERLNLLSATQYHQDKQIRSLRGLVYWIAFAASILFLFLAYVA